jgi:hypothetical protein
LQSGALSLASGRQQFSGEMRMVFENAPAGFRVGEAKTNTPGLDFNPDVGMRSLSYGL